MSKKFKDFHIIYIRLIQLKVNFTLKKENSEIIYYIYQTCKREITKHYMSYFEI